MNSKPIKALLTLGVTYLNLFIIAGSLPAARDLQFEINLPAVVGMIVVLGLTAMLAAQLIEKLFGLSTQWFFELRLLGAVTALIGFVLTAHFFPSTVVYSSREGLIEWIVLLGLTALIVDEIWHGAERKQRKLKGGNG